MSVHFWNLGCQGLDCKAGIDARTRGEDAEEWKGPRRIEERKQGLEAEEEKSSSWKLPLKR